MKNALISILAALVIADAPFWIYGDDKRTVVIWGLAAVLFIFLLFWDAAASDRREMRRKRERMQRKIARIRRIRLKEGQKNS